MTANLTHKKVPVSIITGLLGSGKTTLINRIIESCPELKFGLLINEFGDISVNETQLITSIDSDVVELASGGCICCTTNDELTEIVYRILEREEPLDHLLIETTGLADPYTIALTFLGTELRDLTTLDSIITIIDSENVTVDLFNSDTLFKQISSGDIILLNKIDLVSEEKLNNLEQSIREIKKYPRILYCQNSNVSLPLISDLGINQLKFKNQTNNDDYSVASFQSDRPFVLSKFQDFLDKELPSNIFRIKGILWFDESPKPQIFTMSGNRFLLDEGKWKGEPRNQLLFIGKKFDTEYLKFLLQNCLK